MVQKFENKCQLKQVVNEIIDNYNPDCSRLSSKYYCRINGSDMDIKIHMVKGY